MLENRIKVSCLQNIENNETRIIWGDRKFLEICHLSEFIVVEKESEDVLIILRSEEAGSSLFLECYDHLGSHKFSVTPPIDTELLNFQKLSGVSATILGHIKGEEEYRFFEINIENRSLKKLGYMMR